MYAEEYKRKEIADEFGISEELVGFYKNKIKTAIR
jgi:DNA-binding CsgD family transcriptional regulator